MEIKTSHNPSSMERGMGWGADVHSFHPLTKIFNISRTAWNFLMILWHLGVFWHTELAVWSACTCVNCNLFMPLNLRTKFDIWLIWLIFKKHKNCTFSYSWHDMKFKLVLGIPLDEWNWLVTSSTWLRDSVWNWFLFSKLHITHLTKVMAPSILVFC